MEGYIEIQDANEVLALKNGTENKVGFKTKKLPLTENQKWRLTEPDKEGWRNIIHVSTGLYLTTEYRKPATYLTIESKGM